MTFEYCDSSCNVPIQFVLVVQRESGRWTTRACYKHLVGALDFIGIIYGSHTSVEVRRATVDEVGRR